MNRIDGKYIKKLRRAHGLSIRAFAEKIYASKSSVQRWEQSYVPENEDILNNISRLFGISVEDMRAQSAQEEGLPPEKLAEMRFGVKGLIVMLAVAAAAILLPVVLVLVL